MNTAIPIIQFISLFLLLLVTGVFWGTWFSLSRSMEKISAASFLENGRIFIGNLAIPMRILMPLSILFMLAGLWLYPYKDTSGFILHIISFILIILTLIITVSIEVPIDNQIKNWTLSTLPADWEKIRDKWQRYHTIRTFTSIFSFLFLLASILFYNA